jgi:hypothetical protein
VDAAKGETLQPDHQRPVGGARHRPHRRGGPQIWFHACGRNAGEDPYFLHYYRVNFDGSGLVALTEGNGTHSIQYSPDRRYLIDTYSRVDVAPVHDLRRVSDGTLVCPWKKADISELVAGLEPRPRCSSPRAATARPISGASSAGRRISIPTRSIR